MRLLPLISVGGFTALLAPTAAQQPTLDEVLRRVGEYLAQYETRLSTIVAEEHYDQWIRSLFGLSTPTRQNLVSDFLLMRVADPGGGGWLGFRDVLRVNGQAVRPRDDRLVRSLSMPAGDVKGELQRIGDENARYNLGDVYRTLNVPTLALDFLHPSYRSRSTFRKGGEVVINRTRAWKIDFVERTLPSLIRGARGRDRPARGSLWVAPDNGAVLRTQLEVGGDDPIELLRSRVTVEFQESASLGLRVPVEMRETYEQPTRETGGRATYRNFRKFETAARVLPQ